MVRLTATLGIVWATQGFKLHWDAAASSSVLSMLQAIWMQNTHMCALQSCLHKALTWTALPAIYYHSTKIYMRFTDNTAHTCTYTHLRFVNDFYLSTTPCIVLHMCPCTEYHPLMISFYALYLIALYSIVQYFIALFFIALYLTTMHLQ